MPDLKITRFVLLLLLCHNAISAEYDSNEELVKSESKDGKLEIIKQIKKVNDDGSYTVGYEADDGSFKIESRDVLGNIKGTYGYIDDLGQIKRVSYSTSNSSEVISKQELTSVVQRIPKTNRTYTTRRPIYSTPQSTPSSTTALQKLTKLRSSSTTSTTDKPNYADVVNMDNQLARTSSNPRILLQGRPLVRSTPTTQMQKSEGQLVRPDIVAKPTELSLFRSVKQQAVAESEMRGNILRRQLVQEKTNFDPQQHVFKLQQALGSDATDVYSASVTTGTPRPLFTTTARPRAQLSTTMLPTVVSRPTVRYSQNYQRNDLRDLEDSIHETTTAEATVNNPTPTPVSIVPVVPVPNRAPQEPLVAIKHPFQTGTILVPLSQLQGRVLPVDFNEQDRVKPSQEVEPRPVYVRRLPPPQFRPIPVQVDENGFIREVPRPINPTPYPLPVPVTQRYEDPGNDIDNISPPVSTRDFQKLLQQLILRQTRLERISTLTRNPDLYQPRYRPVYRPDSYYAPPPNGPVRFLQQNNPQARQGQFVHVPAQEQDAEQYYSQNSRSYLPTRRVARLLQQENQPEIKDEYLPPDVREMLLLRMLQLAINPALPVDDELVQDTTTAPQYKKVPVRNVEILGEEVDNEKIRKSKGYKDGRMDYY